MIRRLDFALAEHAARMEEPVMKQYLSQRRYNWAYAAAYADALLVALRAARNWARRDPPADEQEERLFAYLDSAESCWGLR